MKKVLPDWPEVKGVGQAVTHYHLKEQAHKQVILKREYDMSLQHYAYMHIKYSDVALIPVKIKLFL